MSPEALVAVVREFAGTMVRSFDADELLHRLTVHATQLVRVSGAGMMLRDGDGELAFVAASEERVVEAEERQVRARTGACFEAYQTGKIVAVDDLAADERWPEYSAHVTKLGLRSVLGLPMSAFGTKIGALNLYRDEPSTWSEDDVRAAEVLVTMAAAYVVHADQNEEQRTVTAQLHEALSSRDLIGQAKGILMATGSIDADAAFETLRERSQAANRKLREIAREVVEAYGQR